MATKGKWNVRLKLDIKGGREDPLGVIQGIVDSSRGIEASLREWVIFARSQGHTWQQVADALRVSRQAAWERFREPSVPAKDVKADPGFASAVERAYLRELERTDIEPGADLGSLHKELLATAIYKADRTNGGLRFKKLDVATELEARLLRALARRVER